LEEEIYITIILYNLSFFENDIIELLKFLINHMIEQLNLSQTFSNLHF